MAQPTNTYDSYDIVGAREDLSDVITMISPTETPFYSACAKIKADAKLHEWQTDALRAAGDNAHIEGDDTTATARTATTRLGNRTQIFKDSVLVSGTVEAISKAGRKSEMAYQKMKAMKEQKRDIERALFLNNAKVTGNSTTASELAGVPTWLITNTSFDATGTPGADATGDGSDARTDGSNTRAFTETLLNTVLSAAWEAGGNPDTVYLNSTQQNIASGFAGGATRFDKAETGKVNNYVDVYITAYGRVKLVPSRFHRGRDVLILESDKWKVAELRKTGFEQLAKTGDNEKGQIITELTLVSMNEAASGGVFDVTP